MLFNRIDLTNFEDSPSLPNLKDINVQEILKHMAFFKKFGKGTVKRLRHEYSCEMGQESEVVITLIISIFIMHLLFVQYHYRFHLA